MAKYRKLILSLVSLIAVFCLLFPGVSCALLTDDITGIATEGLEASNDISSPILSLPSEMLKIYVFTIIGLAAATSILQWEITNPDWLNLSGSMVQYGWNLTRGLANMFLLLIFVVIAFGFILKIESLQSSKSLPRLIIVALLINFSKLFVGMIVDVATIATNTIIYGHENLLVTVMEGFLQGMYSLTTQLITSIIVNFGLSMAPLAGALRVDFLITSLAWKGVFIASAPTWLFQIAAAIGLIAIFCLYIFLFAARVYIVQILAILSPLAFLCLILPQTQKFWDEWLKHLVQWTFVGCILLFFLMIGLSAGNQLLPNADSFPHPFDLGMFLPVLNVPKYYLIYTFLLMYLAVAFWLVDRTMPMIAVAIMGMAQNAATQGWKHGGKDVKDDLVKRTNENAAVFRARDKAVRDEHGNLTLEGNEKLAHQARSWMYKPIMGVHRLQQTTPEMAMVKYQNEAKENFEKKFGKNEEGAEQAMKVVLSDKKLWNRMGATQRLGFMRYGMEQKGGAFVKEAEDKGMLNDMLGQAVIHNKGLVKETIGHAPQKLDRSAFGMQLRRTVLASESGAKELDRMRDIHGPNATQDEIEQKAAMSLGAKKILGNKDRIKNWNSDALANGELQEAIALNARSSDIQALGESKGQNVLDSINGKMTQIGMDKMVRGNASLLRATAGNSAVQEVLPGLEEVTQQVSKEAKLNFINEKYAEQKEQIGRERQARTAANAPAGVRQPGATAGDRFGGGGAAGAAPQNAAPQRGNAAPTNAPGAATARPTFTPGAAGQRGGRVEREVGETRQAPRTPGTGERQVPITPNRVGTSRTGRTTNVHPDDLTNPGNAGPVTPPPVNRTRRTGQTNLGDFGQTRANDYTDIGNDSPPPGGRSRSGRTTNIHPDDTTPPNNPV